MMLPIEFLFWVLKLDMLHLRYLEHQESAHRFNPLHHVNIEESIGCHKIVLYWQRYIFSVNTSCKSEGILLLLHSDDKTTIGYSAYQFKCWWLHWICSKKALLDSDIVVTLAAMAKARILLRVVYVPHTGQNVCQKAALIFGSLASEQ